MKKLSYIDLINRFWDYFRVKRISDIDTIIYFYLLNECNIRRWLNPFELQTRNLEVDLGISRKTIGEARKRLKQRGFIDFREGKGRGPTIYLINGVIINNKLLKQGFCVSPEKHKGNTKVTQSKHKGNTKVTQEENTPINIEDKEDIKTKDKSPDGDKKSDAVTDDFDEVINDFFSPAKSISFEAFCKNNRTTPERIRQLSEEIIAEWRLQGVTHLDRKDALRHLLNTLRIILINDRNKEKNDNFGRHSQSNGFNRGKFTPGCGLVKRTKPKGET